MVRSKRNDDPISIVETAYSLEGDDHEWLSEVTRAAATDLDSGLGVFGFFYDVDEADEITYHTPVAVEVDVPLDELLPRPPVSTKPSVVRRLYVYGPTSGTLEDLVSWGFITRDEAAERRAAFARDAWADMLCVRIHDSERKQGACLSGPMREASRALPAFIERWERLAAHLAAGLRLRRTLAAGDTEGLAGADAILSPAGDLELMDGAIGQTAQESLRAVVREVERVRATKKREAADKALTLWKGLVAGRWSLVDHYDTDGRRYLIARRNDPHASDPRALTEREREVAVCLAQGQANKLIAYELDVSMSTVAQHVRSILSKMGVGSRVELVRLLRQLRVDRIADEI